MTTEIVETNSPPPTLAESTLAVISRAASDTSVDVEKMERLLQMQKQVMDQQAVEEANKALFAFKEECPQLQKSRAIEVRGQIRSRYTGYDDMMKQVRPLMTKHGFAERFNTGTDSNGKISSVTCTVVHRAGHSWDSTFPVSPDLSGSKNEIQAIGSALSYGKRYAFAAAMGIVTTEEDDDGHSLTQDNIPETQAAWKKEEAPAQEAQTEVLPPEPSSTEEVEAMLNDRGMSETDFNRAVHIKTKGKFDDWRKMSAKAIDKLAQNETFEEFVTIAEEAAQK